ncbi:hypothetical protein [Rhodococcus qingshengii]|uniref:hypothetical protein n=1 Tax=Rhodococcus qingshengii TaxID=334542 RepID=UPI0035E2D278
MTPEHINAIFAGVVLVIGAVTSWQGRQISRLRAEMDELRAAFDTTRDKFRVAKRHIRDWMRWETTRQGDPPEIPAELADDI